MVAVAAQGGIGTTNTNIGFTLAAGGLQAAGNYLLEGLPKPAAFLINGPVVSQTVLPLPEGPLADVTCRVTWKKCSKINGAWKVENVPALVALTLTDAQPDTAGCVITEEATGAVLLSIAPEPLKTGGITIAV